MDPSLGPNVFPRGGGVNARWRPHHPCPQGEHPLPRHYSGLTQAAVLISLGNSLHDQVALWAPDSHTGTSPSTILIPSQEYLNKLTSLTLLSPPAPQCSRLALLAGLRQVFARSLPLLTPTGLYSLL